MVAFHLWQLADSTSNIVNHGLQKGCGASCPNATSLTTSIGHIVNLLLYFVGAISILMLVIGGLRYVISAGNPSAVNDAKNTILYAVVGLVIAAAAYAVVAFVTGRFGL